MNNIRYRAYGKKSKIIVDVGEIHFCQGGIKVYGPGVDIDNGWVTCEDGFDHECEVVLMKYIGTTDKNDKKIFEDDIVKVSHKYMKPTFYAVKFMDVDSEGSKCAMYGQMPLNTVPAIIDFWYRWEECEVVGNIHTTDIDELFKGE